MLDAIFGLLGMTGTLISGGVILAGIGFVVWRIRRSGYLKRVEEQRRADERAMQEAERVQAMVESRTPEENRARVWTKPLAVLFVLVLAACSQMQGGQFCQVAKPIFATPQDATVISDRLVADLNRHNETMAALCKTKRP
jgi:hypothetical protein